MTQTPMKLVPAEPTEEMMEAGHRAHTGDAAKGGSGFYFDTMPIYQAMIAASPHAGQVSREQLDIAARKLREHKDELYAIGLDKSWDVLAEKQRNFHRDDVRVVLAALRLSVEGEN